MSIPPTRRAAAYCRVSSDEQAEHGYSLDDQQHRIAARVTSMQAPAAPIVLRESYVDDGYSGTTPHRPALRRLLADAEAGRIDVVIFTKLDRLARRLKLLLE